MEIMSLIIVDGQLWKLRELTKEEQFTLSTNEKKWCLKSGADIFEKTIKKFGRG